MIGRCCARAFSDGGSGKRILELIGEEVAVKEA